MTWPNEVVYISEGKPASFQDLSISLFIQGYLIIMESEEGLIKQLMATHQDLMAMPNCMGGRELEHSTDRTGVLYLDGWGGETEVP